MKLPIPSVGDTRLREYGLMDIEEINPDAEFAENYPRAAKYAGWPMLVVIQLVA